MRTEIIHYKGGRAVIVHSETETGEHIEHVTLESDCPLAIVEGDQHDIYKP